MRRTIKIRSTIHNYDPRGEGEVELYTTQHVVLPRPVTERDYSPIGDILSRAAQEIRRYLDGESHEQTKPNSDQPGPVC